MRNCQEVRILAPMSFLTVANQTISNNGLLSEGDSVLIGLSGGPDSVALLRLLVALRRKMKLSLAAVYINHQLRPRAATKEERFCQELCHQFAVDLTLVSEDIAALAKARKMSIEEAAQAIFTTINSNMADGTTEISTRNG